MYIAPNTVVRFCQNVPLTPDYRDSISFVGLAEQKSYFDGVNGLTISGCQYQRKERIFKAPVLADHLISFNYMYFVNAEAFGDRVYYCFITNVEYANNETSYVTFEVDTLQTYLFDMRLKMCFVEREHSLTDVIGENLISEGLEQGDYMYTYYGRAAPFDTNVIVVAASYDKSFTPSAGGMYGGVYSGLVYNVFDNYTEVNTFLLAATAGNKSDGIVSIFMMPKAFSYSADAPTPSEIIVNYPKPYDDIDGYVPRNYKLFTYPYNTLYATNGEGTSANFPYEYFDSKIIADNCYFAFEGVANPAMDVVCVPLDYRKASANWNFKIGVGNFPQCAYIIDTYRAYVAQNANQLAVGVSMDTANAVAGAATMNMGQSIQGLTGIANTMARLTDISTQPPHAKGHQTPNADMAAKIKGIQFSRAYIRREYAEIIDSFFDVYGYASHKVKIPNINSRPHWNYVKTNGAIVQGGFDSKSRAFIASLFDKGITFWKKPEEVGNYSLSNAP